MTDDVLKRIRQQTNQLVHQIVLALLEAYEQWNNTPWENHRSPTN